MADIQDLIVPKNNGGLNDAIVRADGPQSTCNIREIGFGHRPAGWLGGNGSYHGVWVEINKQFIWLSVDEARALGLGIIQAAGRLGRGEVG